MAIMPGVVLWQHLWNTNPCGDMMTEQYDGNDALHNQGTRYIILRTLREMYAHTKH